MKLNTLKAAVAATTSIALMASGVTLDNRTSGRNSGRLTDNFPAQLVQKQGDPEHRGSGRRELISTFDTDLA